ncbi:hypothetical protein CSHISOI_04835 [Colletotrichum shisoi]|uniref:Uncharacterized protein n=1 Tax=Colletotrichum shisoi TaxID=2078593 RepID=A0A5Q4BL82_9PEZI|nr:hypothetical protein CSHISOI_04835 [Colletotrichum shisoi]
MAQASHPTFINLPPPTSRPDTPSEMPGTPTSTTTSMSALSTTAIKDGHRGHFPQGPAGARGHAHHPSTTSLEAERADRISRLAGLERVSTLRAPPTQHQQNANASSLSPQTTPTSTGFPPNYPPNTHLTPAYFDAHGQPTAVTKMSTVGTASATESNVGDDNETRTAPGEQDEDMFSMDTNYREADSVASTGADPEQMDEDTARSTGGYDDRMSDDGSASLVGFGEGANSTVSGPIYQRRPIPGVAGQAAGAWGLERTASGLSSEGVPTQRNRDVTMGGDTPTSAAAMQERRDARMMDGTTTDGSGVPGDEMYVDTTNKAPVPTSQLSHQPNMHTTTTARDTAERLLRERLDGGESRAGNPALGSYQSGENLGKVCFEERK